MYLYLVFDARVRWHFLADVRKSQSRRLEKGLTLAPAKCRSLSAVRERKPKVAAIWRAILSSGWVGGQVWQGTGRWGLAVGYRRWSKWSTPLAVGLI
ncbi:hypothetical protein MCOR27_003603 [Pyricularia oryzae]|uniref:Uncharacterized protein n=4 Tax=Pyricularia TaxID=48558 RepID=A0ABQ8NTR7_PYRGI|nr:uncharacterized protein MGG_16164 [Pyricularia oryzae 70-15]ELQ38579.1 hypothetical protein OOU_Y34scaffold00534g54 [Pyricularia oryzae Y34]KAH8842374.1 hypothetical protein MCOR01_006283 [Pyricularia oryzae]KAI6302050.1 hypothetical protein MCOR33_002509 [Pyricularia grisea]EHA56863.1 hypothetical protein MGG_16164 [Pyricularia oryzae 70-15]KAI6282661.1 hypothetical protein MCOR27_003603 [Pyricularia oryzae]